MSGKQVVESINYTYLGVSVVLLIVSYYLLYSTKLETHKEKKKGEIRKDTVLVQTDKGEIKMDPNIFEMHMNKMKDNIIKLSENLSNSKCGVIKQYLDDTKDNTKSFIELNNGNYKDFCNLDTQYKLVDNHILKEREFLR